MKKLFITAMLAGLLGLLGACAGSDANKASVANVTNSGDPAVKNVEAKKKSGGQLTIVTGDDKSTVKVSSTRFT